MKQVVQVKLMPTPEQSLALTATLQLCNQAANLASDIAHSTGSHKARPLQAAAYLQLKGAGLSAQPALLVISKVAGAYAALAGNLRPGNLGRKGSPRRTRAESKAVSFREDAAQPFDDRCLSWQHQSRTVSIWTSTGRMKNLAYTGHQQHLDLLANRRQGETDLIRRGRHFYLLATIDLPDTEPQHPTGFLGVDMGLVVIAAVHSPAEGTDHDWSGKDLSDRRTKNRNLRSRLQKKGTKSAKRLLKARSRKEARFAADINHKISHHIVAQAQRTGQGISVEELTGIRDRVRLRKTQRATHTSWSFDQLGRYLEYKARRVGVAFIQIDPAYTSQECSHCSHIDRKNRPNQATFLCQRCGLSLGADTNAARVISRRGQNQYVGAVYRPNAA